MRTPFVIPAQLQLYIYIFFSSTIYHHFDIRSQHQLSFSTLTLLFCSAGEFRSVANGDSQNTDT